MKISKLFILISVFFLITNALSAQNTYIPDDKFEQALIDLGYDSGELNDSVPTVNINSITDLDIADKGISDLTGIESFKLLEKLLCQNNELSFLEVSYNPSLNFLDCSNNNIDDIDVSKNSELEILFIKATNIVELNLNFNLKLTNLFCSLNFQLERLSVKNGNNHNMRGSDLEYNGYIYNYGLLSANCPRLLCVEVDNPSEAYSYSDWYTETGYSSECSEYTPAMTYIPDDNFEQYLIDIGIDFGSLNDSVPTESINRKDYLNVQGRDIKDLTGISEFDLYFLDCSFNNLTELDVSKCPKLIYLDCQINKIKELNLSENTELQKLRCYDNELEVLNIKNGNNHNMQGHSNALMIATNNSNLTCIEVDNVELANTYANWQKDETASYSEDCNPLPGKITVSEYLALEELFDNSAGPNWINKTNWLDTTNSTVNDWFGVTIEDGHVTKIELPNNNLQEVIFSKRVNLPELTVLDLSSNLIDEANFSNLDSLKNLVALKIENNRFTFKTLESIFFSPILNTISGNFTYNPQAKIGQSYTKELKEGESSEIDIDSYYFSENDEFQWYKNNQIIQGANQVFYEFTNASAQDAGIYYLKVTNPKVPDLYLTSQNINVTVATTQALGAGIPIKEYLALEKFYNDNIGDEWDWNGNWLDTINYKVNDWQGILVENGHVHSLNMDSVNTISILSDELVDLKYLNYLSFFNVNLNIEIPSWIGEFAFLESLHLEQNNLKGEIPTTIGQLTNLKYLSLGNNKLTGYIPTEIGNCTKLRSVIISNNNLTGNIPTSLGNLSELFRLYLYNNSLSGLIPTEIGNITKLTSLRLDQNQLSGTIPTSFGNLTELRGLDLSNNLLVGPVPKELENLTKLYRIDIDNNLIGANSTDEKSAVLLLSANESNRQIPDEMANLLEMDTLYLGDNKLQFNDIEAIFSWDNFSDFKDFVYSPQAKIGAAKTITAQENNEVEIFIDNYYPGPSDKYQWYKNGYKIQGATNTTLQFTELTLEDAGDYYCKVANSVASDLILRSYNIQLIVNEKTASSGIPLAEYETLAEIYNLTNGNDWTNHTNWLDTINYSVADWFGITVKDEHVTEFVMPENGLSKIPHQLNALLFLEKIDLSGGEFEREIPDLSGLDKLAEFSISNNKYTFSDLLPITNWNNFDTFKDNFNYSPQAKTGIAKTISVSIGEEIDIEINNYFVADSDSFCWFKNEELLIKETNNNYKKQAWYDDINAIYYCEIINPNLPNLTLISKEISIEVLHSTNDSLALVGLRNEYDLLKDIWTSDSVFTWPHITVGNGCVIAIDFSNLGLNGVISQLFSQFDSLSWLNLANNNLSGAIPFFSNNKSRTAEIQLEYLNISNNSFGFADLEANKNQLNTIGEFIYAPQFQNLINIDTIVYKYDSILFEANNVIPGEYDLYNWGKDCSLLNGENQMTCSLENIQLLDSGTYVCTITNSLFPDLNFYSNIYNLKVLVPVRIEENELSFQVYPNPTSNKVYVDTKHKQVELKIYSITGKMIYEKTDFISDWINIEDLKKGIYLFQLKSKTDKTWTKKVVFR